MVDQVLVTNACRIYSLYNHMCAALYLCTWRHICHHYVSLRTVCGAYERCDCGACLARCPVASDSCKGTVDAIQEHCTQSTTLVGGEWEYISAVDTTQAKHRRSIGIREAIHASAIPIRGGSNYFRGGPNISEI